ncbi:MAG: hypothetical protein LBU55_04250 [Elusimicrobiota bacterium]|nr:hypothetical protein [Elusimicrobiota bacterium]
MFSCSVLDYPCRFAGFSVEKFKNEKNVAFEKNFLFSKKEAFEKTLSVLNDVKARVTHKNFGKGYIVAFDFSKTFDFCLDSTEIAVFISEEMDNRVNIKAVSNNTVLARMFSYKLFEAFSNKNEKKE